MLIYGIFKKNPVIGKYNCLTYFYELLGTHFNDYFNQHGCM